MSFPLLKSLQFVPMASENNLKIARPPQSSLFSSISFHCPTWNILHQDPYHTEHGMLRSSISFPTYYKFISSEDKVKGTMRQEALSHIFLNIPLSKLKVIPSISLFPKNGVLIPHFSTYFFLPCVAVSS